MNILSLLVFILSSIIYGPETRYVEVNGTQYRIRVTGSGSPTLIFESGMATSLENWKFLEDSLRDSHVFMYDRAGIGMSEASGKERTIPNMVEELRAILDKEDIEPPYLFIAHSMGSYPVHYFACEYPHEVSGILLLDPSPHKLYDDYSEEQMREYMEHGNNSFKNSSPGEQAEWEAYLDNRKYIQPIPSSIPMIILSATQWDFYTYHEDMLNDHVQSSIRSVESSHNIQIDRPGEVVRNIRLLLSF
jgi:pimeloyl-ACP methyl ester carboxylesterase